MNLESNQKQLNEIVGFEHLHVHSHKGSLLDGWMDPITEGAPRLVQNNQKYFSITDHGMVAAVPDLVRSCNEFDLTPIYGCELYVNPYQPDTDKVDMTEFAAAFENKKALRKSHHLLAIAFNEIGYRNLVRLSSWGWTNGHYGNPKRPRVNHEQLMLHKEGIFFTSCCYAGEIGWAFDQAGCGQAGEEAGFAMIEKYMAMFGQNFFLEIMLLDFKKQKPFNSFILKAHDKYKIPLIVTQDAHYANPEDAMMQRYMLMIQTKKTIAQIEESLKINPDQDFFELQDTNLWMKSEIELNEKWVKDYSDTIDYELFKQAKMNTVEVCRRAANIKLDTSMKFPVVDDADEKFKEEIMKGFMKRGLPKTAKYLARLQEEFELIRRKGFCSYFLIQKEMSDEARRIFPLITGWGTGNEACGPGRGSAGGSLVCYCLRITDVDPIKHDLLFSRFLSENRGRSLKIEFSDDAVMV